jgi:hypothetical protein
MATKSTAHGQPSWWQLDPRRVLVIAFLIALFAMSAREIADPDFWWHLKTGQYIVETRSIPRHDVFSYTARDHRWITHEWLAQVLMFGLYRLGGLPALLLATCTSVTLTFALVYLQCDARPHLAVFVALLGALASAVAWGARPQMANMLMAAWFAYLLERYRSAAGPPGTAAHQRGSLHQGQRRRIHPTLWLLPLSTALWANLHSGFVLGLALIGLVIAGECAANLLDHRTPRTLRMRQVGCLALALAACVLASLANPNGVRLLIYPLETLGSRAMQQYIQEWASPDFHRREYWAFAVLLLGGAATLAFTRRKRDLTDVLALFGLGFAGLLSARHIPLFAVVAAPIVTRYAAQVELGRWRWDLTRLAPSRPPSRLMAIVNWALVLLVALGGALYVTDVIVRGQDVEARRYPVAALEYIETHGLAGQRMYNSYNWGGYLLWRGYPVFIDGRADVYMDAFMDEYVLAYQLRGDWRRPLEHYAVDYVLIESGASLEALLEASDEWTRVYRDDLAVIFIRSSAAGG